MRNNEKNSEQPALTDWKKIPETVGFRLDDEHRKVLFERACKLKISIHDLARFYVVQMLHEADERQQLISAVVTLKGSIDEARTDIAVSTQELLVSAGKADFSEAQDWVKENLKSS